MTGQSLRGARVALLYSPGHLGVDYASSLVRGIERAFFELGAQVATLNTGLYRRSIESLARTLRPDDPYPPNAPLTRGIIDFVRDTWADAPFDLCFGLFHDIFLSDELTDVVRRRCKRIVNYPLNLLDQPHRFERAINFCDETFCSEEEALAPLREKHGANKIRYVPMAADPFIHRPIARPERPRLLFVGSLYADRALLLERCAEVIDVSIYGPHYDAMEVIKTFAREFVHNRRLNGIGYVPRALARVARRDSRIVSDEEFVRLASEHGISIGFSSVRQERTGKVLHKVRLRDYESTMCGLCHIAKRLPELERSFQEGEEIIFHDSETEILDILARIRKGEIDWAGIGKRARARAERDHTWTRRLGGAFNQE